MEDLITLDEIYKAYIDCRKHKKNTQGAKEYAFGALEDLNRITQEINTRTYQLQPSECFIIMEPTAREVFCASFRDRIVQHFIYNELLPFVDNRFIYDTSNCRVGKGTDFAISRVYSFIRKCSKNFTKECFYLKIDLSGFFMNIDHNILWTKIDWIIDNLYKGNHKQTLKYLCKLMIFSDYTKDVIKISPKYKYKRVPKRKTLFNNPFGLPIGNISSQFFANIYLNNFDHMIKHYCKYYSRYVDDLVIISDNKNDLISILEKINNYLPQINERVNINKTKIRNIKEGIPYLGVIIYPFYIKLGKGRINRLYRSLKTFESADELLPRINSRKGSFMRYSGFNVSHEWYSKIDKKITKNFYYGNDFQVHPKKRKRKKKELLKLI